MKIPYLIFFKDENPVYRHFNANPTIFAKPTEILVLILCYCDNGYTNILLYKICGNWTWFSKFKLKLWNHVAKVQYRSMSAKNTYLKIRDFRRTHFMPNRVTGYDHMVFFLLYDWLLAPVFSHIMKSNFADFIVQNPENREKLRYVVCIAHRREYNLYYTCSLIMVTSSFKTHIYISVIRTMPFITELQETVDYLYIQYICYREYM